MKKSLQIWLPIFLLCLAAASASAQSFRVQCPPTTITHPVAANNNTETAYNGPTQFTTGAGGFVLPTSTTVNGAIKCQQVSGGDGYATMADGTQTFMFSFGPLSGLADIAAGRPGTQYPSVFNTIYNGTLLPGDPATTDGASDNGSAYVPGNPGTFTYNGAVGLANDLPYLATIYSISEGMTLRCPPLTVNPPACNPGFAASTVTVVLNTQAPFNVGDQVVITGTGTTGYDNTSTNPSWTVTAVGVRNPYFASNFAFTFTATTTGLAEVLESTTASAASLPSIDGHVDPRPIMDVGVMNGNIPAPLVAFDEDDEMFLTLTNVGMIMRPDLFEQHTIHFHG